MQCVQSENVQQQPVKPNVKPLMTCILYNDYDD